MSRKPATARRRPQPKRQPKVSRAKQGLMLSVPAGTVIKLQRDDFERREGIA